MVNLRICIAGYTDTVSVYVNDDLLKMSSLLIDANYTYSVSPGVCNVRITKRSDILNKRWKKKVALNWLSCLSGIPDFTIRDAMLEANISSICFNINVTDIDQIINVRLKLNPTGFEIVHGIEQCRDIHVENKLDNIAMRRIKIFYLLPVILLLVVIFGFLISVAILFIVNAKIHLFLIVLALIIILSSLFIYLFKKSVNK